MFYKEINRILFMIILSLTLIQAADFGKSECPNEGRFVCLRICGWKSVSGKICPQGKQCCQLRPRNNIYETIKNNLAATDDRKTVLGDSRYPVQTQTVRRVPFFTWSFPRKSYIKYPWFPEKDVTPLKEFLPMTKYPWSTLSEKDDPKVRPARLDVQLDFNKTRDLPSFDTTNDLSSIGTGTEFLATNYKVILDSTKYMKPKPRVSLEETESTIPLRKSARYCKEYSKIAKRSVQAMPLLPYSNPFTFDVDDCGPNFTPLIVGGKPVSQKDFPHMAALGYKRNNEIEYLCGGSLISEKFVLTAAHCSKTRWGLPVEVHLGSSELYSENGTRIGVNSVIVHPAYSAPACYDDIALVKLAKTPTFGYNLRPACLPVIETPSQQPGSVTMATGWGKLGFGRESSMALMKVSLKIINNDKCQEFYLRDRLTPSLREGISTSMICASGHKAVFHDTCQGDSGGPLQSYKEGSKCMMEIIGITSFGKSCGTGIPAVYTRVASYLDWIENTVWP